MITGIVRSNEPQIRLKLRGPRGLQREIEAVVDTGYTGTLTLSSTLIAALELPWQGSGFAILADGSETRCDVYEAHVLWDRRMRLVRIDEANATPLVGMELMKGFELNVKVRERGKVTIKPLA